MLLNKIDVSRWQQLVSSSLYQYNNSPTSDVVVAHYYFMLIAAAAGGERVLNNCGLPLLSLSDYNHR